MTTTLITGGNRSLGLETARRLIEAGHTVYAGMRGPDSGAAARALGAHVVQLDVTYPDSVDAAVAELDELDVLVNNAGILGTAYGGRIWTLMPWLPFWPPTSPASCG